MKMKPSKIEECEQIGISSISSDLIEHVRSYTCSFCKKGFLNAQALGGHMNIHRKDRARLRESSFINSNDDQLVHDDEKTTLALKRPWNLSLDQEGDACSSPKKKEDIGELLHRGFPLFVEGPSSTINDQEETSGSTRVGFVSSLVSGELDLELRLGPDTTTKNTREMC